MVKAARRNKADASGEQEARRRLRKIRGAEHEDLLVGGQVLDEEIVTRSIPRVKQIEGVFQTEEAEEVELQLDGRGKYQIVNPSLLYRGKSYSDWVCDWFNWFISVDADKRNSGPVVFLSSQPNKVKDGDSSSTSEAAAALDALSESSRQDPSYAKIYPNNPNIKVGSDRLQIYKDQAVLIPIINAYELASVPYRDWGTLTGYTGPTIDYGDNPPTTDQLTINNKPVNLPQSLEMSDFRILTSVFMAIVPEAEYGRSRKDFLEVSVAPGQYPAVVEGYFVMLKFEVGSYWIHSLASGPREYIPGPYVAELLYQIEVLERAECDPHGRISTGRPSRNEHIIKQTLFKKKEIGELTPPQINRFQEHLL